MFNHAGYLVGTNPDGSLHHTFEVRVNAAEPHLYTQSNKKGVFSANGADARAELPLWRAEEIRARFPDWREMEGIEKMITVHAPLLRGNMTAGCDSHALRGLDLNASIRAYRAAVDAYCEARDVRVEWDEQEASGIPPNAWTDAADLEAEDDALEIFAAAEGEIFGASEFWVYDFRELATERVERSLMAEMNRDALLNRPFTNAQEHFEWLSSATLEDIDDWLSAFDEDGDPPYSPVSKEAREANRELFRQQMEEYDV